MNGILKMKLYAMILVSLGLLILAISISADFEKPEINQEVKPNSLDSSRQRSSLNNSPSCCEVPSDASLKNPESCCTIVPPPTQITPNTQNRGCCGT